ncbi:hypothetical protein, partial [Draconibacterium mangrovi]|uniref:hypothetical protein n=1 Tax=Draconibacterium mangrovi TaxID=2697469 RepID=UPI0013D2E5E8
MRENYEKDAESIQGLPHWLKTLNRCWRLCYVLPLLIIMALISTTTTAQQVYLGTAPVQTPVNGFAVDANAYANYVPGDTIGEPDFGVAGDWFYVPHWPEFPPFDTVLWEGPGRGILRFDGPIYPDMTTVYVDSISGDPDYTTFLEKTKIDENPNTYTWGEGNVPPKNEIQNVAVHFTYGDPALGGDPDDLWCLFAADRMVTNGSSYIDFEFLQDSLLMTTNADGDGIFTSEGPDFGRNVGDLLVTVELTNGGAVANVILNKWSVGGKNGFEYHTVPIDSFPANTIYATNNNEITYVPFPAYDQIAPDSIQVLTGLTLYYYDVNQWVEGAVNLSALFNLDENPCFTLSTVFVRTRSSGSSSTSQLKDIPGPPIQLGIDFADLEVFAPTPVSLGDCLDKEAVRTQFEAWLDGFYFTGGVPAPGETEIESNIAEIQAHAAEFDAIWETIKCGGTVEYTLTVDDYCDDPIDKTSSFTLADAAPLVLSDCPGDPNLEGCSTEGEIGTAWDLWIAGLESMTETGGCSDGVVVFDPPLDQLVSPVECDPAEQVITVTAIAESYCFPTIEKTCTFTVQAYPDDLTLDDCPGDPMLDGCSPQSEITSAWNDWMAGLMAMTEGGTCSDGVVVFDPPLASLVMPLECVTGDQVVNVTAIAEDHCNKIETPCSFTVYAYPDDL